MSIKKIIVVRSGKIQRKMKICLDCKHLKIEKKKDIEKYFCILENMAGTMDFHMQLDMRTKKFKSKSKFKFVEFKRRPVPERCGYRLEHTVATQ